ncbi:hypothetical protein N0B31_08980 [Salinirubellus salinus]|uniref:Uncharacterized protein n=1 Tax=Salinirubellus salinus TaxID=1364945 RepID=A0A9E7R6B7_9EURY|nr:hypothetical protein [Salinirubellus salinus]UWM56412.1 hypothetical protein N0B31_08980 [Salinirubellus salinus]
MALAASLDGLVVHPEDAIDAGGVVLQQGTTESFVSRLGRRRATVGTGEPDLRSGRLGRPVSPR